MQKALFLDRDGIINIDYGYVSSIEKFEFSQGIFTLLHLFQKAGYLLFIVTNQSGIGRGYYHEKDFKILTKWMIAYLKKEGITIEEVYYCPHAPEENCTCRKPQPGMLKALQKKQTIDFAQSWMMGDKQSDIDFAQHAGIAKSIAIGSKALHNATYHFDTIVECVDFFNQHKNTLL